MIIGEDVKDLDGLNYLAGKELSFVEEMAFAGTVEAHADGGVPVMNSLLYAGALAKHNIPCELHVYPFGNHGLATVDEHTNNGLDEKTAHAAAWLPAVKKWLKLIF